MKSRGLLIQGKSPRGVFAQGAIAGAIAGIIACMVFGWAGSSVAAPHRTAILQGLDKVTARVSKIEAPIGQTVRFGSLEIIVRHCDKRPPEETPESAAFLDIWEVRPGEAARDLFRGWMFASSPALSAMEHPVYDVWVLDCADEVTDDAPASSGNPESNSAGNSVGPAGNPTDVFKQLELELKIKNRN